MLTLEQLDRLMDLWNQWASEETKRLSELTEIGDETWWETCSANFWHLAAMRRIVRSIRRVR